jgi:uncharacterized membrane protein (UPF0182 family)
MTPPALVVVLAASLIVVGLVAAVVHRSIRNRRGDLDTAASVTIMAIAFAAVSIVALELILTRLERLLL